jgi:cyclopropane fatty-acyl-phospholipid synthase-like methyltransferase
MRQNSDKVIASNDAAMWDSYHRSVIGTPVHALNVLKTTIVCRMFASKILSMSGPVRSVLELGCGTGSTLAQIQARTGARCVGIDRSDDAAAIARKKYPNITVDTGDIFKLPYEKKSFDLVYSVGLFEHFTRTEQCQLLAIHADWATRYSAMMVPADSLLMNSILFVNKRLLKRTGYWADEEVFSPANLREKFPAQKLDDAAFDYRFGNLIMWFGWRA